MSMSSGTAGSSVFGAVPGTQEFAQAVALAAAAADEDERPDNMELLVGDVKGKVSRANRADLNEMILRD